MIDDIACCPDCRGQLVELTCSSCGRSFSADHGVVQLLPLPLEHMAVAAPARSEGGDEAPSPPESAPPADEHVRWVEDEMAWWDPRYATDSPRPFSPHAGLRGRSRERNLLRPIRPRLPSHPLVIEMGAGTSLTAAGLLGPARYIATDVSASALRTGRAVLPDDAVSVQCDAVGWPFREGVADVVMILGVLHHLSDWRAALDRACRTVRPGGFLLLHEAVTKPRVLGRWRSRGVDDDWVSPHEGDVPRADLLSFLAGCGSIERVHGEESPLRFALVRYLIHYGNRYALLDRSRALTMAFNGADQAFGRTLGRAFPSLGFNEVTVVWRATGVANKTQP